MTETRLNPLDAAWIQTESRATPNHVGGLLLFRLPPGAPRDYLRRMMVEFRGHRVFAPPWNRRLKFAFNLNPAPVWVEDDAIDLEYHVRHAALPWPGGERELGELVGRLQSTPIDLTRPPWECTIIEGLDGDRFGLFVKMHHSLIDGVSGMNMLQRAMSTDRRRSEDMPPFWATGSGGDGYRGGRAGRLTAALPTMADAMAMGAQALSVQVRTLPQLAAAFGKIVRRIGEPGEGLVVPFDAPRSALNGRVREKRRFATQQFAMDRLRAVARAGDCTLNDVVLAVCAGALRRFLDERGELPARPLTAGIPVSVRPADDEGSGTLAAILIPIVTLFPFEWLYPTGDKQNEHKPKYENWYQWATVIAGDCLYIKRHMPLNMQGKVVVTNTTTPEDVEFFRKCGIKYLITTTPVMDGRSFGTNMMEAALVAISGKGRPLSFDELNELLDKLGFEPQLQELN